MLIVVFNVGSSSIKCQLIDTKKRIARFSSIIDRFGTKKCEFRGEICENRASDKKSATKKITLSPRLKSIEQGIELTTNVLLSQKHLFGSEKILAIAHRVVHGGENYTKPTLITTKVIKDLEKLCDLAPLHNPPNIAGIRAAQKIFGPLPHIAIFDTAFYGTLPEKAFLYAVPYEWYTRFGVRRYGFHGTSHEYVTREALALLNHNSFFKKLSAKNTKIISCHLGNGCSITASIGGKAMETSMGFTPLEGIPMGTRSGSIDPAIIPFMEKKLHKNATEIIDILNHASGLKGLSGISSDMRDIRSAVKKKDKKAIRTYELFVSAIAKTVAGYTASLGGLDALVFTSGIGENAEYLRRDVLKHLNHLKSFKTFAIHTHEELFMALQAEKMM